MNESFHPLHKDLFLLIKFKRKSDFNLTCDFLILDLNQTFSKIFWKIFARKVFGNFRKLRFCKLLTIFYKFWQTFGNFRELSKNNSGNF